MKNSISKARRFTALLLVLTALFGLVSCLGNAPDKTTTPKGTTPHVTTAASIDPVLFAEELRARVEETRDADYSALGLTKASDFIKYWNFPPYESVALTDMELVYARYYVGELPDASEIAFGMAELIIEVLPLLEAPLDKDLMTDLLLEAYLLSVGDKYASYMNPETLEEYLSDMEGDFVGIGVKVIHNSIAKTIQIVSVIKDTPAMAVGLLPGDMIHAIDGALVSDLSYYEILDRIRGVEGTTVEVVVDRNGELLTYPIVRARIVQTTAEGEMLDGNIGYIRITEFDDTTFGQFKSAFEALEAAGAVAFVFDVRDNPGGALTAILAVLDYLIVDGEMLASYRYKGDTVQFDTAKDGHSIPSDLPIAVLMNAFTASAGELFSCALSDYADKGLLNVKLVGTTTYGKGMMQSLVGLPGNRATTVSVAFYNPPYSRNYEGIGVLPDIESHLSEEAAKKNIYLLTREEDTQLADAISAVTRPGT